MSNEHGSDTRQKADIVSIWEHQTKNDKSAIAEMRAYWDSLRCGRTVPLRSEIDPREIAGALEFGFILERLQPGAVRFRLAGMHLCDLMGMEVRGMPLRAFISPSSRAAFSASLERVFSNPEIHEYHLVSEDGIGAELTGRLLILPLKSDHGEVDRAIGCLITDGVVGLAPRRFRVAETRVTSLETGEVSREVGPVANQPHSRVAEQIKEQIRGFAEKQTPFKMENNPHAEPPQSAETESKRPALRLVVSNEHLD